MISGTSFRIRIGATVPIASDNDNDIWGPDENEKEDQLASAYEKGSHPLPHACLIRFRTLRPAPPLPLIAQLAGGGCESETNLQEIREYAPGESAYRAGQL
jgi:hypothetical protein